MNSQKWKVIIKKQSVYLISSKRPIKRIIKIVLLHYEHIKYSGTAVIAIVVVSFIY